MLKAVTTTQSPAAVPASGGTSWHMSHTHVALSLLVAPLKQATCEINVDNIFHWVHCVQNAIPTSNQYEKCAERFTSFSIISLEIQRALYTYGTWQLDLRSRAHPRVWPLLTAALWPILQLGALLRDSSGSRRSHRQAFWARAQSTFLFQGLTRTVEAGPPCFSRKEKRPRSSPGRRPQFRGPQWRARRISLPN